MKRTLAALAILWSATAAGEPSRPPEVVPSRYALTLAPDLAHHSFSGRETIDVRLSATTRVIELDSVGLEIVDARVRSAGETLDAQVHYDPARQTITLALPHALPAGGARLTLGWTAPLSRDLDGFYETESRGRRYAFTHFEPSSARRAFPCFDTPSQKARFALTVVTDTADSAISNTPIEEVTPLDARQKMTRFAETPPLPTYLVAVAVGRLAALRTTVGSTPVAVIAPDDQLPLARFALDTAAALLPRFEAYFDRRYPFAKLDLVAVPAFAPGGMENAGAIFLRDDRILVDQARASPAVAHGIARLVAHELAHQWLGDLVTPAAWNDLWLNEATATYVAHEILDGWRPAWRPWDEFQTSLSESLADDELPTTHPVRLIDAEAARPAFDSIVYGKGAAVLRMFAGLIGPGTLQGAFRRYLHAHEFASADAADLWSAIEETAGRPLAASLRPWLEAAGHPLITVGGECDGATLTLRLRQTPSGAGALWTIPLGLRWPGGARVAVVTGRDSVVRIDGGSACPAWVDANAGRIGFYRVRYAPALARALDASAPALAPAERAGLLSDTWFDVRSGGAPIGRYLALVERLRGERAPAVLEELATRLEFIATELVPPADRAAFARFVDDLAMPAERSLGWTARAGDDDTTRVARADVIDLLGRVAGSPEILADAARALQRYLADPTTLDGAVADVVVALAGERGGPRLYQAYLTRLRAATSPAERARFLDALPLFRQPRLLHRTLWLALTDAVPPEVLPRLAVEIAARGERPRATEWSFLKAHFEALDQRLPRNGWLVGAAQQFCDAGSARDVARFLAPRSSAHTLQETIDRIVACAAVRRRAVAAVGDWLRPLRRPAVAVADRAPQDQGGQAGADHRQQHHRRIDEAVGARRVEADDLNQRHDGVDADDAGQRGAQPGTPAHRQREQGHGQKDVEADPAVLGQGVRKPTDWRERQ